MMVFSTCRDAIRRLPALRHDAEDHAERSTKHVGDRLIMPNDR